MTGPTGVASAADDEVGAPVRVVVVDDHPVVRDGLTGIFDLAAQTVVVGDAASGPEALDVVARVDPDVVLMDLRMPGGDGPAAIRALKARDPARPRVLVLTTYDTERDVRAALDAGADGFLLKDARAPDLVRGVLDVAAGRSVLTASALEVLRRPVTPEATARELDVLRLVAGGRTNAAVATRLGVSEATVKTHLGHLYEKWGVPDRAAAVRFAVERGLI